MHVIDAETVHEQLAYSGLIEALSRAHRDSPPWIERTLMQGPDHGLHQGEAFLVLPAWFAGVDSIAAAIPEADIICCATGTMDPLIRGELLHPGQHLDLVGSFNPSMRESDDDCVRRARLFVDFRATTVDAAGDLFHPITDGLIDESDILADLFELCSGQQPGRREEAEITLFKNGGGAHLDLSTAEHLVEQVEHG